MKIDDVLKIAKKHSDVFFHGDGKPTYVFDEIGLNLFYDELEQKFINQQDKTK